MFNDLDKIVQRNRSRPAAAATSLPQPIDQPVDRSRVVY
jgi:hypothetical protein